MIAVAERGQATHAQPEQRDRHHSSWDQDEEHEDRKARRSAGEPRHAPSTRPVGGWLDAVDGARWGSRDRLQSR